MDSTTSHNFRDRSRPPYHRTASRSSTSTSGTRITNQTQHSGGSSSPQLQHAQTAHRYHHASCAKPSTASPTFTPRATPQLSREPSSELTKPSAMSSFLQEKLQRERQSESHKNVTSPSKNGGSSASMDMNRAHTRSPFRESSTSRPKSSSGDSGQQGHGVKEMEKVISSLHKQNFDLKLELYHRRERQTALDERVESLETDKAQLEQMNDKLMEELEKRDKAVEEAVAMIITLEAKMEQLAQERRMIQQIEAEGLFRHPDFASAYEQARSSLDGGLLSPDEQSRTLNRQPSFLNGPTEDNENLRNVYLNGRSSIASLPRASEQLEGLGSPSLSVLSESSFISVYGQKGQSKTALPPVEDSLTLDGGASKSGSSLEARRPSTSTARSGSFKKSLSSSSSRTNVNGQFQSISDVVGQSSPLQRLEKMDPNYTRRPQSSGRDMSSMNSSKASKSPGRRRTRDDKRPPELRKVMTDAPGGVRLQEPALPPTPDTMSSSTLRRFRNSNDTLEADARNDVNIPPVVAEKFPEPRTGVSLQPLSQPIPNFLDLTKNSYPEGVVTQIRRPRSADETTVSQHRRPNDWDFDSDDDDAPSLRSSLDIWMRQGGAKQDAYRNSRAASPDLFGFPTSTSRGTWAMDSMFGPGSAYAGGAEVLNSGQAMDELFSAQGRAENQGPPPPGRRSSYHARTASSSNTPTMTSQTQAQLETPKQKTSQRRQQRQHARGGSVDVRTRPATQDVVPQVAPPAAPQPPPTDGQEKRGHYPPLSGSSGARAGLNRLFRRSISGAADAGLPPRPPSAPIETRNDAPGRSNGPVHPPAAPQHKPAMGTPSWISRSGVADDDLQSATPPPIMRNPRQQRGNSNAGIVDYEAYEEAPLSATMQGPQSVYPQAMEVAPPPSSPGPQQQHGGRRKWLPGFGRSSSLRNRS